MSKSKEELLFMVFKTRCEAPLSLQRFDNGWNEFIDIKVSAIQDRDKLKICPIRPIQDYHSYTRKSQVSTSGNNDNLKAARSIEQIVSNLNDDKRSLEFQVDMCKGRLSSLKEVPKQRPSIGRNLGFTCSNCHFKGHRVTSCQQPQCEGFFECGLLVYHKEHKEQIKEVGYFTHQESDMTCVTFDIKRSKMF